MITGDETFTKFVQGLFPPPPQEVKSEPIKKQDIHPDLKKRLKTLRNNVHGRP